MTSRTRKWYSDMGIGVMSGKVCSNTAKKGNNFHFQVKSVAKEEDKYKQLLDESWLGKKTKILSNLSRNYANCYCTF